MRRGLWQILYTAAAIGLLPGGLALGAEIAHLEAFSLGGDRAKALEQLTPGTEDHDYFHCLHYQLNGDRQNFDRVLRRWTDRAGRTERNQRMRRRQLLLDSAENPRAALEMIRHDLGLTFEHRRVDPDADAGAPAVLSPAAADIERRVNAVLQGGSLDELTDEGLSLLGGRPLRIEQVRQLLARLTRPDFPGVVSLVLAELADRESAGFGSLTLHRFLTLEQLEQCVRERPGLLDDDRFVRALVSRLRPPDHVDLEVDGAEREQYLQRLLTFARRLGPAPSSLEALVLHHLLRDARAKGKFPRDSILEYLALPRGAAYQTRALREPPVALPGTSYQDETGLPPISNDEELVRDCLAHLALETIDLTVLEPLVDREWLRKLRAETRILAGDWDLEKSAVDLSPGDLQALRDRVDLEITPANPRYLKVTDPVKLIVRVKNISSLIVRAFEIDPFNLYRQTGSEIDQAIDLDGLVAAHEERFTYDVRPFQSIERTFEFPWMTGRGVWVVELTGNGKKSRAVIRKGRLQILEKSSSAGTVHRIVDETGSPVSTATLWQGNKEYQPDASGRIVLPFVRAEAPGTVILRDGGFASIAPVHQRAEKYELQVGFHVERDSLVEGQRALLLIRPSLTLAGSAISVDLLEDVRLTLEATDLDGITTREEVAKLRVADALESIHSFQVPARLQRLRFTLRARVDSMRDGKPIDLESSAVLAVGDSLRSRAIHDWYLRRAAGRYLLTCLGRAGEPAARRRTTVSLRHRAFRTEHAETLQTDVQGRIELGTLSSSTRK